MPEKRPSNSQSKGESLGEVLMRIAMYLSFVGALVIPLLLILNQSAYAKDGLVFLGAAELAFGFYAFTAGNSSYSMVPAYSHRNERCLREDISKRASRIIQAGRVISMSAILLIFLGLILLDYCPRITLFLVLLIYGLLSLCSYTLSENMEVVPDQYAVFRDIRLYKAWKRKKEGRKISVTIFFLGGLLLLSVYLLRVYFQQLNDDVVPIFGILLIAIGIVLATVKIPRKQAQARKKVDKTT